ncbi:hypothetical protein HRG84_21290 [Flavisolibacter sp. BT320]|nr:hypothetical protein [Flavisolibacter longurius]
MANTIITTTLLMLYKEWKFLASHYVLRILRKQTGFRLNTPEGKKMPDTYRWMTIYQIEDKAPFFLSKETLFDAAKTMFVKYQDEDNEVDMLFNANDLFDSEFRLLDKGLTAAKEAKYLRSFLRCWKIIIGMIITAAITILGLIKLLQELKIL